MKYIIGIMLLISVCSCDEEFSTTDKGDLKVRQLEELATLGDTCVFITLADNEAGLIYNISKNEYVKVGSSNRGATLFLLISTLLFFFVLAAIAK